MDAIFILSTVFFAMALIAPIFYLWKSKREIKPNSQQSISEMKRVEFSGKQIAKWHRDGLIVHPIKYVNGGISAREVMMLRKGVHPICHTHIKLLQ